MDYDALITEFLQKMQELQKTRPLKQINESMHGEALVLIYLSQKSGQSDVIPSDISAATSLSSARIAATLNGLESKGFITREIDTEDRRRIIVKLTQNGKIHHESLLAKHKIMLTELLKRLGEEDAKEFIRLMDRVIDIFADSFNVAAED